MFSQVAEDKFRSREGTIQDAHKRARNFSHQVKADRSAKDEQSHQKLQAQSDTHFAPWNGLAIPG